MQVEEVESNFFVALQLELGRGKSEKAILVGSDLELKSALSKDSHVFLKKAAIQNNVFVPVVGPVEPIDPTKACWDEIRNYYNAHLPQWQQQANQTCKDVYICLTCPNSGGGLFVLYVIKPNSPKCNILEAQYNFSKFNFSDRDYDSDEVKKLLNANH